MRSEDLITHIVQQLEAIDRQQASLQSHKYIAQRFAQLCNCRFAELELQRTELEQLLAQYEQSQYLYGKVQV